MAVKMGRLKKTKMKVKNRPMPSAMSVACNTRALAFTRSFAPSARLMAEEMPPPMEPADSICCNMTIGNTKAMPARGRRPNWPTYQVSAMVTSALAAWQKDSVMPVAKWWGK